MTTQTLHSNVIDLFPGQSVVNDESSDAPLTLHLYHAAKSICSQKVRVVLAATGQSYVAHSLDILAGDTYTPEYVRLRMRGCKDAGLTMVANHSGHTSVASSGCDACVVPTVVDEVSGEILVDSVNICMKLAQRSNDGSASLVPGQFRSCIASEINTVDLLPNYPLLAVTVSNRARDGSNSTFTDSKIARCDAMLSTYGHDPELRTAYKAKRDKELDASEHLFSVRALATAEDHMHQAISGLNERLSATDHIFLFGDVPTLADYFWGIELVRLDDLGFAHLWQSAALPRLKAYYADLCSTRALRQGVLEWPGARLGSG